MKLPFMRLSGANRARIRNDTTREATLIRLLPVLQSAAANELSSPHRDGRKRRRTRDFPIEEVVQVRPRTAKLVGDLGHCEDVFHVIAHDRSKLGGLLAPLAQNLALWEGRESLRYKELI
jgi:hypothetical protein